MTINVSSEIQDKLKLDRSTSFCDVRDWNTVPKKKFDRVLYYFQPEDNEEEILSKLTNLCSRSGLILICGIPQINLRLSNGTLKQNKDIFTENMNQNDIKHFWFLGNKQERLFDFLMD